MGTEADATQSVALRQIALDAPDYKDYRPLSAERREIRVLDLTGESACTIRHVSLDEDPVYYALSYYWGPPTSTKPLSIHQIVTNQAQSVPIRRTLASFLKHLYRTHGSLTIWLDVICIDQRSFAEQSAQVAMMGDIYRQARGVYAWMGKWDPDIDYLFDCANRISRGDEPVSNEPEKIACGLQVLSQFPYWTRVWIIQECVLNDSLVLMCGSLCVEWEVLLKVVDPLKEFFAIYGGLQHAVDALNSDTVRHLTAVKDLRLSSSADRPLLLSLVQQFSESRCSDTRDKIYGLRAIARNGANIAVDYRGNSFDLLIQVMSAHNLACFQNQPATWAKHGWNSHDGGHQHDNQYQQPRHQLINDGRFIGRSIHLSDDDVAAGMSDLRNDWLVIPIVEDLGRHELDADYVDSSSMLGADDLRHSVQRYWVSVGKRSGAQDYIHFAILDCGRIVACQMANWVLDMGPLGEKIANNFSWRGHICVCRVSQAVHISRALYASFLEWDIDLRERPGARYECNCEQHGADLSVAPLWDTSIHDGECTGPVELKVCNPEPSSES